MKEPYVQKYVRLCTFTVFRHRRMKGEYVFTEVKPDEYELLIHLNAKGWARVARVHDADLETGVILLRPFKSDELLELSLDDVTLSNTVLKVDVGQL